MHRFVILRNGHEEVYNDFESIPRDFDHVLEFLPEIPPGPHTPEEHEEIDSWNERLQELMRIEYARSGQTR